MPTFNAPFLLGFEQLETALERASKLPSDGYPPYNIERLPASDGQPDRLRITLAVAGFARGDLEITVEDNHLYIEGRQVDDPSRDYLHRGIAARHFKRTFVLADGIEVRGADLQDGLLAVDLIKPAKARAVRTIDIG